MCTYPPTTRPGCARRTGWTDCVGHLGAWGGVLIAGALFVATKPRNFVVFITIPCALVPGLLVAAFGKRQHPRTLEEVAHYNRADRQLGRRKGKAACFSPADSARLR